MIRQISNIQYKLKRHPRARRIILKVKPSGVELTVPYGVPIKQAETFLISKNDWIKKRTEEIQKYGNRFFLFGKEVFPKLENGVLKLLEEKYAGFNSTPDLVEAFEDYTLRLAKTYIPKRVREIAHLHNFKYGNVRVRKLSSRWGSCSSKNNLSFNSALLKYSKEAIDYVIIHELCHTIERNHSKNFWALVESIMPDYKQVKKELKKGYPV